MGRTALVAALKRKNLPRGGLFSLVSGNAIAQQGQLL
jgi:hypothetical protein